MNYLKRNICLIVCAVLSMVVWADDNKLSGTPIGSSRSWNYASNIATTTANTPSCAFDGDPSTYFAAYEQSMGWVGLDLGTPHVISRLGFQPKNNENGARRMLLGVFEGANNPDFSDAIPLYLIPETPANKEMHYADVNVSRGVRYVRYVGPAGTHCDIAELAFYGTEGEGTDEKFYQITCLPTISIHVANNGVPSNKGEDFESTITIVYEGGTLIQEYPLLTRVRGNFSATHENKPYRIKFNDGKSHHMLKGSAHDESPAKAKKWTLINSFGDKTLIRNNIAFEISRRVEMNYTPYCRNVDLLLNGEYRGTYQLTDWLGIDENRVNITEMSDADTEGEALTGGYFIEMNGYAGSDPVNFTSKHGNPVTVHSPEDDWIQSSQFNYIRKHFNQMEDLVYANDYTDPEKGYRKMLDLDSFLKYFLSCELAGNTDMIWQVFMYKERGDDHIYTGPVWDNDLAMDNDGSVYPGNKRKDWTYTVRCAGNWGGLITRVLSDGNAMARLQDIWAELRDKDAFTSESMAAYVDSLRALVNESQRLNFIRWPYLTQQVHCNPKVWGTWDAEVDCVRDYVAGRVNWMDNKLRYSQLEEEDGHYLISTPRDLIFFAKMVNNGQVEANAVLTADLDMSYTVEKFIPIGDVEHIFCGSFDGKGHTINGLRVEGTLNVGLFGVIGNHAQISNLTMGADCTMQGTKYVGALVGSARGTKPSVIANCGSMALVKASQNYAGGLVGGVTSARLSMTDCYHAGTVESANEGAAMIGWAYQAEIRNCFNTGSVTGSVQGKEFANTDILVAQNCYDTQAGQVNAIESSQVQSGELCWLLNNQGERRVWHQNIDNGQKQDAFPLPRNGHGAVYETEDGRYTNVNPNLKGFRYFKLDISGVRGGNGNLIQFSEFDILDNSYSEYTDLSVYKGTESNIPNENWMNVADNSTGTKYCADFQGRATFLFDAGREVEVCGYRIYTANDTQGYSDRNPVTWTLSGSNTYTTDEDDPNWIVLDEKENDETLQAANFTPYDFYLTFDISSITLNQTTALLNMEDELQLEVNVNPATMTPLADITWSSSDMNVATVDANGHVRPTGLGTCLVTATSGFAKGLVASCEVTVTDQLLGYRYFLLAIDKTQGESVIQLSEFDLIDNARKEVEDLSVVTSNGNYFDNEHWNNLCDNEVSTKWCGNFRGGAYCIFDAGKRINPAAYRMYTANDTQDYSGRNPSSWRLYGSNTSTDDDTDARWKLLDERKNDFTMGATNFTPYDFEITYKPSAISQTSEMAEAQPIYDLQGRRVTKPAQGIYIQGGKKILVR